MENDNLKIYEKVRDVPKAAQKEIAAGRLKGKTDINPMWRIKTLTEQFGPCGIGWYTVEKSKWMEKGAGEEVAAFVDIDLFVKIDGTWSEAIPGTGGSMFVSKEKGGLYTDDEAYKKAYTDAISVACKALGIGADVYWDKDATKYTSRGSGDGNDAPAPQKRGEDSGRKGAGSEGAPRRGITLTELRDFGVTDIRATAVALAKKFKKGIDKLDEDETAAAWAILRKKKAEKEAAMGYDNAMGEELPPWEQPTDEDGSPL